MARINFGYVLRKLRHNRDETLEQVSEATGLSVAMLSRVERGERLPSPDSVEALARHFKIPVDYLMSETIANRMVNRYGEESGRSAAEHMSRESEELGTSFPPSRPSWKTWMPRSARPISQRRQTQRSPSLQGDGHFRGPPGSGRSRRRASPPASEPRPPSRAWPASPATEVSAGSPAPADAQRPSWTPPHSRS